jgi:hypothetical protein
MVKDMNVEQMGFIDGAYFGFVIHKFQLAKSATLALGKESTVDLGRLALIGPRNLTKTRAQTVLEAIEAGDAAAVRAAVNQYEDLAFNLVEGELDDEALMRAVKSYIDGAMDDLTETLDTRGPDLVGLTSPEMADWADEFGGIGYQIGFAPEEGNLWRLIKNPETEEIVGVNPWIDWVDEASAAYRPDRFTRMREAMFRGIRGEKIQRQARDRFIRIATEWPDGAAVSVKDADAIFHAVMKAANAANIMPRGLSPAAMWEAARKVNLPDEVQAQIGPRQIVAAITRAFEGNFATVGATQKASGIIKTEASVFGNTVGQVAEHLYPMARFTMNPVFQAQEFVEPFILATMRGIKPGVKLSEYDRDTLSIVNKLLKNGVHLKFDQAEFSDVMLWGASEARRTFGVGTRMGRVMRAIVPDVVSRKVGFSVAEAKQVAYAGQIRKLMGDELYLAFNQFEPGYWGSLERHYGTVDRAEIAFRWLSEKVSAATMAGNDAAIVARITKPNDLGKVAAVEIPFLRRLLGKKTVEELFTGARKGDLTEEEVRVALENIGASPEYIARTWMTLTGVTPAEFEAGLRTAFKMTPKAAANLMLLIEGKAAASGVDIREWIATRFVAAPTLVDAAGRIPRGAFFQSAEELFGRKGMQLLPYDDARVVDTRTRMEKYIPKGETVDFEKGGKGRGAKIAYDRIARGGADDLAPKAKPTQLFDKHGQIEVSVGKTSIRDWMKQAVTVLGRKGASEAGRWYQEMATTFLALTDGMGERELRVILGDKYDDILSKEQAILKGGTPESGGAVLPPGGEVKPVAYTADQAVRQEAAAKLLVSWGLSQLNTSPSAGWGNLLRLVDDIGWGRRPPVAVGYTKIDPATGERLKKGLKLSKAVTDERNERITRLMAAGDEAAVAKMVDSGEAYYKGFGLNHDNLNRIMREGEAASQVKVGEKLFDFLDSIRMAGMRNYKSHLGDKRMPAAGDIWAARDVGFVDQTTLIRLAAKMGLSVEDAAKEIGVLSRTDPRVMVPNAKGKPIFSQTRYDAVAKETGLQPLFVNVSDSMYEYIVQYYNDAAELLNREAFDGRTNWTAADAQAIGWVRAQKSFGIASDDPSHIQALNSRQVAYEIKSGSGSRYETIFPQWDELTEDAQRAVMDDWNGYLVPKIEELTGVRVISTIKAAGTWLEPSGRSTFTKNATLELMGTDDQIQDAIEVIAYLSQQNAVYASRAYPRANTAVASRGQFWAVDFVPEGVLTDDEMEEMLHLATQKSADIAEGASIVTFDDGRKGIRTIYFGSASVKRSDFVAAWPDDKFDDFIDASVETYGKVKAHRRVVSSLQTSDNWLNEDNGNAILQSLRSRGRRTLADSLEREHAFDATAALEDIYLRRAPDATSQHRAVLDAARADAGDTLYQFADTTVNDSARYRAADAAARDATAALDAERAHSVERATGSTLDEVRSSMGIVPERWDQAPKPTQTGLYDNTVPDGLRSPVRHMVADRNSLTTVEVAQNDFGNFVPIPGTEKPIEYVYRAVSEDEWQGILKNGYMKSDGRANLTGDEGTVAKAGDPSWYLHRGDDTEGRIIRIKVASGDGWKRNPHDSYLKTGNQVPSDRIDMVSPPIVKTDAGVSIGEELQSPLHSKAMTALAERARVRVSGVEDVLYQMDSTVDDAFGGIPTYVHGEAPDFALAEIKTDLGGYRVPFSEPITIDDEIVAGVERFYDRGIKSWTIHYVDEAGNQVGDSVSVYSKAESVIESQRMINAAARQGVPEPPMRSVDPNGNMVDRGPFYDSEGNVVDDIYAEDRILYDREGNAIADVYTAETYVHGYGDTRYYPQQATRRVMKGRYPELRHGEAPTGVKPNKQIQSSKEITPDEERWYHEYGKPGADLCDSIGFSSWVGEFTGCQGPRGHAGSHFWHHGPGGRVKIERWDESATYDQYVQFMSDQGIKLQRGTGTTPRTVRGAAAFAADGRATLFGTKHANRTTALHELAHVFERDLEPSMRAIVIGEMKKVAPASGDAWTRETSEWFADGFNTYLATRKAPTPALATAFEFFAKWLKTVLKVGKGVPKGVSDEMASLYDDLLKAPVEQAVPYDLEQETMLTAAVESLRRVEDEAYQTQYFKRSRSWTERSANHPYLGYYPASYYWGKILPEMVRFLTLTPFGIKAPMAGWVAANKVWESIVTQKETDPEMRKFMADNEKAFRSWGMFIPATPFDIPVNAALPYRRLAQADVENRARIEAGKEPLDINTGKILKDTFMYAFGPAQSIQTLGQMFGYIQGTGESMLAGPADQLNDVFTGMVE